MGSDKLHGKQKDRISTEMYLKTILQLRDCKRNDPRPIDMVHILEVSKSSVSEMLRKLSDEGLVHYESYGRVKLTPKGKKIAESVARKFSVLQEFLSKVLGIPAEKVYDEACNLEHAVSDLVISQMEEKLRK